MLSNENDTFIYKLYNYFLKFHLNINAIYYISMQQLDIPGYINIQVKHYINDFSGDREEAEFNILCLAIACINATIQNSFTGPLVEIKLKDLIPFNENIDVLNKIILRN